MFLYFIYAFIIIRCILAVVFFFIALRRLPPRRRIRDALLVLLLSLFYSPVIVYIDIIRKL